MSFDLTGLQEQLDELAGRYRVPGAGLAVLADGTVSELCTGVVNCESGVETTPESVFQIGSITKVYTATLVMRLVDEGRLDLDAPVVEVLPELALNADAAEVRRITLRHLLSHSSGIHGDHFVDTGRGDDCLERFVVSCAGVGLLHPVGATMSYCNAGFSLAGRVIEKVTGQSWDAVLRERLTRPLGVRRTVTLPEDTVRFRVAYGHRTDGEDVRLVDQWVLPRSGGPAGRICATAADVVTFAGMHLADDGAGLLSAAGVATMREPQIEVPGQQAESSHRGLGWGLAEWGGRQVIGHNGGTIGQFAFLRVVPDAGVAVALLTNGGGHPGELHDELFRALFRELCGLEMPARPEPPAEPVTVDLASRAGVYERLNIRMELRERDNGWSCVTTTGGLLGSLLPKPVHELELVPVDQARFVARSEDQQSWTPGVFYELDDGSPYLHFGGRAARKTA
jgi:CubicO group peptidase (beta-lactamase class C family)